MVHFIHNSYQCPATVINLSVINQHWSREVVCCDLLSPDWCSEMVNRKRGNVFEYLPEIEEDKTATSSLSKDCENPGESDFKDLKKKLEDIEKNSSEVRKNLEVLKDQVEDIKNYFENDWEEVEELFAIDEDYFKFAYIDTKDENKDLYRGYENEEELWKKTREIAEIYRDLVQIILKKRKEEKRKNLVHQRPQGQVGELLPGGADERLPEPGRDHCWKQRGPDPSPRLLKGGDGLHGSDDQVPGHGRHGHPQVQKMVHPTRFIPHGNERSGGLSEEAWPALPRSGGDAHKKAARDEAPRGPRPPERGQIQVGGGHGQAVRAQAPQHRDDKEATHGIVSQNEKLNVMIYNTKLFCDSFINNMCDRDTGTWKERLGITLSRDNTMTISDSVRYSTMAKISVCTVCQMKFPSINAMKTHKSQAHPTPAKPPGRPAGSQNKPKEVMKTCAPATMNKDTGNTDKSNNMNEVINIPNEAAGAGTSAMAMAESTASPKLSNNSSSEVMRSWINGATRSNQIGAALAAKVKQDGNKTPASVATASASNSRTEATLEESINLLDERSPAPAPQVSTLRLWPPEMEAIPILEEGGAFNLRQRQSLIESEPEKPKRLRERYEDDTNSTSGKKLDERSTPEDVRANASHMTANPRNLSRDFLNTQEVLEVEFGGENDTPAFESQEDMDVQMDDIQVDNIQNASWDIEGHNVRLISNSTGLTVDNTNREEISVRDTMTASEINWMTSATFSTLPPSPSRHDQGQGRENEGQYGEGNEDLVYLKDARIDELTVRLEEALSKNQDSEELVGNLESKVSELQADIKHYRDMAEKVNSNAAENCSKLQADVDRLRRESESKSEAIDIKKAELVSMNSMIEKYRMEINEKKLAAETATLELEAIKAESIEAMKQVQREVARIEKQAKADVEKAEKAEAEALARQAEAVARQEKMEGERRAESERAAAAHRRTLGELKQLHEEKKQMHAQLQAQQSQCNEVTELKAALVKAQGEKDLEAEKRKLEKMKADKADEMVKRMEDILKDAQEEKAKKEVRNSALEHKIKIMKRQAPCDKPECDMSCGQDHHCGTPVYRSRRRSRSRNFRATSAPDMETVPTVANLATSANVPTEKMQQLVDQQGQSQGQSQAQAQAQAQAPRLPPRPNNRTQSTGGGVEICRNFHYYDMCVRGAHCKFAHELIPANALHLIQQGQPQSPQQRPQLQQGGGRAFTQAVNSVQKQAQQNPAPKQRSRSGSAPRTGNRPFVIPHYNRNHPDYEWAVERYGLASQMPQVAMPAGNANGQSSGASAVQNSVPQVQVIRPKLSQAQAQAQAQPQPAAPASIPAASTPAASSGNLEARRTVSNAISQQASNQARMNALKDSTWKSSMDNVLSMVAKAYRPNSAEEKTPSRNSSVGTSGSSNPANQN